MDTQSSQKGVGNGARIVTFTNGQHGKWASREVVATFPDAASITLLDGEGVDVAVGGATARFSLAPWQSAMLEVTLSAPHGREVLRNGG